MWWAAAVVGCSILASVFLVVAPRSVHDRGWRGLRAIVLRWGHSLTWGLLAASALARLLGLPGLVARLAAALAACGYAAFLLALLSNKRSMSEKRQVTEE
jgi:hypothetical protein